MTGSIPGATYMPNLLQLDVSNGAITDRLPLNISGAWPKLELLDVSRNPNLVGPVPESIGDIRTLKTFAASENGNMAGPLPRSFFTLPLGYLYLQRTSLLVGIDWGPLITNLTNLRVLDFSGTALSGTIPATISNLPNLETLYLPDNNLTGAIPVSIDKLRFLSQLYLQNNSLSGTIPPSISYVLPLLKEFSLKRNNFVGCFDQPQAVQGASNCHIDSSICGCTRTVCDNPQCPVSNSSCVGVRPTSTAVCSIGGVWVIPTTVSVRDDNVTFSGPTLIGGDLVLLNRNVTVTLGVAGVGQQSPLTVAGCVSLNGQLQVNLNSSDFVVSGGNISLATYSGFCSGAPTQFTSFQTNTPSCVTVTDSRLVYGERTLALVFGSVDSSRCNAPASGAEGVVGNPQLLAIIIGCSVAGGIILIVIIAIIVAFNVEAVRNKLMPWRARRRTTAADRTDEPL